MLNRCVYVNGGTRKGQDLAQSIRGASRESQPLPSSTTKGLPVFASPLNEGHGQMLDVLKIFAMSQESVW